MLSGWIVASLHLERRMPEEHDEQRRVNRFMLQKEVASLACELMSALQMGRVISVLPSSRPGFDLEAAYAVEAAFKRLRESDGHRAVGRKVGYANKAIWRVLQFETLVWANM